MRRNYEFRAWDIAGGYKLLDYMSQYTLESLESEFILADQCIHFKDKNGAMVFERDILRERVEEDEGDRYFYYVVTWIEELARFALLESISEFFDYYTMKFEDFMDLHYKHDELGIIKDDLLRMSIISNVFENKDEMIINNPIRFSVEYGAAGKF